MAATMRRRKRPGRPMTESEACLAYAAHVRTCGGCGVSARPGTGWSETRCQVGLDLFNRWRATVTAQNTGTQPIRRERARVGRR